MVARCWCREGSYSTDRGEGEKTDRVHEALGGFFHDLLNTFQSFIRKNLSIMKILPPQRGTST